MISYIVSIIFRIFFLIILLCCILSWLPIFDARKEPFHTLWKIFRAIMAPFSFIPPIGMIDISPIIAIFVYGLAANLIIGILIRLGL